MQQTWTNLYYHGAGFVSHILKPSWAKLGKGQTGVSEGGYGLLQPLSGPTHSDP